MIRTSRIEIVIVFLNSRTILYQFIMGYYATVVHFLTGPTIYVEHALLG